MSNLWNETPLLYSPHISGRLGHASYLKLENMHQSHSFKYRGISLFVQRSIETYGPEVHVIAASGGNAGLAVACAANHLKVRCTVYIPKGASASTIAFLKREKAEVVVEGNIFSDALRGAEAAVAAEDKAILVPAYDHPTIWEGHGSMVTEIASQLGKKPDAIVCSVGGGGLLGGLIVGCEKADWDDVPIFGMETLGSNCFYSSMSLNSPWKGSEAVPEDIVVSHDDSRNIDIAHLPRLPSRAKCLGATWASPGVVEKALKRKGGVKSICVSDTMCMSACDEFAEEHKILVELACAATLTAAYEPGLTKQLLPLDDKSKTIVFIVCGGFSISMTEMVEYREIVKQELDSGITTWRGTCDGKWWETEKYSTKVNVG